MKSINKNNLENEKEPLLGNLLKDPQIISRVLSALIAIVYIIISGVWLGGKATLQVAASLLLPLACIWFSEAMGAFTGFMSGHKITAASPASMVAFGGWFLLLLPVFITFLMFLIGE